MLRRVGALFQQIKHFARWITTHDGARSIAGRNCLRLRRADGVRICEWGQKTSYEPCRIYSDSGLSSSGCPPAVGGLSDYPSAGAVSLCRKIREPGTAAELVFYHGGSHVSLEKTQPTRTLVQRGVSAMVDRILFDYRSACGPLTARPRLIARGRQLRRVLTHRFRGASAPVR
jgi:hypothetical protein